MASSPAEDTSAGPFNLAGNVRAWVDRMSQRHNAQTARAKASRLRRFTDWLRIAGITLSDWRDVTPALVDRFIAWRMETPAAHRWRRLPEEGEGGRLVKPATIARDVEALARWLAWNEEREMTGSIRSVYLRGRVSERRQGDTFSLTKAQQEELLRCAWQIQRGQNELKWSAPGRKRGSVRRKSATCTHWPAGAFHAFCRLGLELGLRPRELFWVAWEDFSELGEGRAVLEVRDHHAEVNGRRVLINAIKTRQSRRKLLVPAELWAELTSLRESLQAAGDLRRFLFAVRDDRTPHGWAKPEISFAFRALKDALAEPRLVCHTLRKTCAKNLRDQGLDYFDVAQFLGHSPQTTLQHYVSDCRQEEAFDPVSAKPVKLAAVAVHVVEWATRPPMYEPLNFLAELAKDDRELYLAWQPAERKWAVRRHSSDGAMPRSKTLIAYISKADAIEDLRGAGFSTTHSETLAGELWTRDPRKGADRA